MAWIESHQSLGSHIKLRRLARELHICRPQAVGHLQYLWWWALDNAPSGDLSALAPAEIAEAAEWTGSEGKFLAALTACGWLDADGHLHKWGEYAGRLIAERERDRERKRIKRMGVGNPMESTGFPKDVRRMSDGQATEFRDRPEEFRRSPAVPNPTQPNPTKEEAPASPPTPNRKERKRPEAFNPPTIEEAVAVCVELGMPQIEARKFINYHETKGWKIGKDTMKSWRAAMNTWHLNWQKFNTAEPKEAAGSLQPGWSRNGDLWKETL